VSPGADRDPHPAQTTSETSGGLLAVGLVGRAHGVRGEVSVQQLSEVESRFEAGSVLLLGPEGNQRLKVTSARTHGHRILVTFEGIGDRDAAESLRGRVLLVREEEAPALPPDRYWVHEVVGMEVLTEEGRSLGTVREVLHNPANDVWLVGGGGREFLIPALRDVVAEVDPARRRAVIRELPGLLGENP
jgi:16S rRNA processing protein RimM